jgi:hypothetical protein
MKLSDIDLTTEEVTTLRRWLSDLRNHYELEVAMRDADIAEQAATKELAKKLVANARECADLHGPIPWMLSGYQATAAWESWMEQAGYYEIDEHFEPDDEHQDLWETAYRNRIEELRRS